MCTKLWLAFALAGLFLLVAAPVAAQEDDSYALAESLAVQGRNAAEKECLWKWGTAKKASAAFDSCGDTAPEAGCGCFQWHGCTWVNVGTDTCKGIQYDERILQPIVTRAATDAELKRQAARRKAREEAELQLALTASLAAQANATANRAETGATEAKKTAGEAKISAATAISAANSAKTTANTAVSTANRAETGATEAKTTADKTKESLDKFVRFGVGLELGQTPDILDDQTSYRRSLVRRGVNPAFVAQVELGQPEGRFAAVGLRIAAYNAVVTTAGGATEQSSPDLTILIGGGYGWKRFRIGAGVEVGVLLADNPVFQVGLAPSFEWMAYRWLGLRLVGFGGGVYVPDCGDRELTYGVTVGGMVHF
ncbi:MAG TPA: alanine-zipper protein [Patescibacteria group bacterium]|nr:alanine-zipper protein [Patescibacteria group bacterium]